jgi:recombination protein RecA
VAAEEFVPEYASKLGCDLSRIIVANTNIMEVAYDTVIEYLDSRAVDCVVIDSLPALQPASEDEDDMADFQVGLGARLTNKFFRKQGSASKRSLITEERPVTGLMVNQFREKIGVRYGDPRTTPGGKGKNFYYFTRVEVRRDEWIEDNAKQRVGQTIKARTTKNKSAPPQKVAELDFYFADSPPHRAGDYDGVKEVMNLAVLFGIVTPGGGGMYSYQGEKWKGRASLLDQLRQEPDLQRQIGGEVLDTATLHPIVDKDVVTVPVVKPGPKRVVRKKRA